MRSSLSKAGRELTKSTLPQGSRIVPVFLCPSLLRTTAHLHSSTPQRRPLITSTSVLPPPSLPELLPGASASPSQYDAIVSKATLGLPAICPGCGALQQTVKPGEAGFYSTTRKSVKAFCAQNGGSKPSNRTSEDYILKAAVEKADDRLLSELGLNTIVDATDGAKRHAISLPVCDRCHGLLHHQSGTSIDHPSLQSIRDTIYQSSYKTNHIYHVIDAADFPLSLIPNLHRDLELNPQRSHNRRAKTGKFLRGRRAEVSFIITRSDLLAPKKEQVDSMMPYLVQVLRDALGAAGRDFRLGNVRCVSSHRGWWTKEIKEDIWRRGGASWMVGKVNVGKSRLFESVFPKGRLEGIKYGRPQSHRSNDRHSPSLETQWTDLTQSAERDGQQESIEVQQLEGLDERLKDSLLPPPSQPEALFPAMPLVSSLPGTTASPIRLPFGKGKGELIDLPGLFRGNLDAYVRKENRMDLVMRTRVNPKQEVIKPGQSLLLGGLIRITPTNPDIVILAYPFVPIAAHVTSTEKARAIQLQQRESGVDVILEADIGNSMASAGSYPLKWDVTKQRSGPLTSPAAVGLSIERLPYVVLSTDILIEGCGWIELVAQVRKSRLAGTKSSTAQDTDVAGSDHDASESHGSIDATVVEVEVFSPGGPGAVLLPKDVKRIHLDFAVKLNDGHLGPRKFWRHYLPRLKYHNPAVPMTVNRTTNQSGPATLTVFFAPPPDSQSPTSSPAPTSSTSQSTSPSEHTPFERAQSIDLKHRREPEIMALLMATTKATPVHATVEEQAELEEFEEQRERSERDTTRSAEVNAKRKREAEVLAQARGELAQAQAQAV